MIYGSTRKPRILDMYCGAGGCSAGYADAGFEVVGVDIQPQPKYPFEFHQGDAIQYLMKHWKAFDAVHASPPCQQHSHSTHTWKAKGKVYPELVAPTRQALLSTGLLYVIENVPGAPLVNPIVLCGTMFGLPLYRHRLFETSFAVAQPLHPQHIAPQVKMGRKPKQGEFIQVVGHFSGVQQARNAMQISWMGAKELSQAIPPAYTRYIGSALLHVLEQHPFVNAEAA